MMKTSKIKEEEENFFFVPTVEILIPNDINAQLNLTIQSIN